MLLARDHPLKLWCCAPIRIRGLLVNFSNLFQISRIRANRLGISLAVLPWFVAGGMAEAGYTGPISAMGYGDSRFQDIDNSIELSERYRLARRIDVIVPERRRKDANDVGQ